MELSVKDVARLLNVSERTLGHWIKSGKIPAHRLNNEYLFSRTELGDWILRNKVEVSPQVMELFEGRHRVRLATLLRAGGIHKRIRGADFRSVLSAAVELLPLPEGLSTGVLLEFLLEREELVPTAVGHGIAIPHPRHLVVTEVEFERISLCFPETPVNHAAADAEPIHSLFVTLSASPKRHIETLSRLSLLCQQEEFLKLLRERAPAEVILEYVERAEAAWEEKVHG